MQTLEIKEDIYERFLKFKLKHKPHLSNEDFIQFLMTQFEKFSSTFVCNGYTNGVTENPNMDCKTVEATSNSEHSDITPNNESLMEEEVLSVEIKIKQLINDQLYTCPECKYISGNQNSMEQHFYELHNMIGAFPCTCGQCFNNMAQFLAHYIICPIAATDLQHSNSSEGLLEDDESIIDEDNELNNQACENESPIEPSRDPTPDSNDQPIDFHIDSPSFSNPINLVKHEKTVSNKNSPITDYTINGMNFENNNISSNDNTRLPENTANTTSSVSASPPGNFDRPKKANKIYECEHCEKNFKSKGLLDQHKHLHFPPRHECEYCGRRFRWPPQFYTHKQQCSKRKVVNDSQDNNNLKKPNCDFPTVTTTYNNSDARAIPCVTMFSNQQMAEQCLCGYKSNILTDMYEHKHSCITSARAMILQKIIDYKSMQTSSVLPNMPTVNGNPLSIPSVHSVMQNFMHTNINSSNHSSYPVLSVVDNIGASQNIPPVSAVTTPVVKSQDEKPFECDFCESRFMTKISLKQHLDGKHSDQAKYCCEKCGKGYFWNASYNYHKKKCNVKILSNDTMVGLNQ